jgi:hypothetical protein
MLGSLSLVWTCRSTSEERRIPVFLQLITIVSRISISRDLRKCEMSTKRWLKEYSWAAWVDPALFRLSFERALQFNGCCLRTTCTYLAPSLSRFWGKCKFYFGILFRYKLWTAAVKGDINQRIFCFYYICFCFCFLLLYLYYHEYWYF